MDKYPLFTTQTLTIKEKILAVKEVIKNDPKCSHVEGFTLKNGKRIKVV